MTDVTSVPHFAVVDHLGADRARLHLKGELDVAAADVFLEHFDHAVDGANRSLILIDVSDLAYCDSSGIRALLIAAGRCRSDGSRFRIVGAHGVVRRVFELTDVVEVLNLEDS